ncbi:MAG: preprotein translocase subunit SecA [Pirellulaceae bacterium]|jgi:preprotein translocase subunit SecA
MMTLAQQPLDRSAIARATSRRLGRTGWIQGIIVRARSIAATLDTNNAEALQAHTRQLRMLVKNGKTPGDGSTLALAAAGVILAVRRALRKEVFDVQLHAGIVVSCGAIAEMQTGEGKTIAGVLPAYIQSLTGLGVHVVAPNDYLAQRDHAQLSPVFHQLGLTTGSIAPSAKPKEKQAAYGADITYGSSHALGIDYLRDQLGLDNAAEARLGDRVYSTAITSESQSPRLQRGLNSAIIDEVDHVLIDDAVSPLLLSHADEGEALDAEVHRAALACSERLIVDTDFQVHAGNQVRLTEVGFHRVYATHAQPLLVHPALLRPWHEYVVLALRARICYQRDIHYVVRQAKVQIVDTSTGRIFADRTWSDGLQQAIEAREGVKLRAETKALARVTRQRLFRQYAFLGGMTGTAAGCEREFTSVYGLPVTVVPLRTPCRRVLLHEHFTRTTAEKIVDIADAAESMIAVGRAVLIGTLSIAESLEIARELQSRNLSFQLLNGIQDADEATLISQAGRSGAITVATCLAGRGTDIQLDPQVAKAGGLHVVVAQKHALARVDRQLIGRSARCGDPGSAQVFVSAEDAIVNTEAPWLARAIRRWFDRGSDAGLSLDKQLWRAQWRNQESQFAIRQRLLRSEREDEKLFAQSSHSPAGCWQL